MGLVNPRISSKLDQDVEITRHSARCNHTDGAVTMSAWVTALVAQFFILASLTGFAADFQVTFGIIEARGANRVFVKETTNIPFRDRKTGMVWGFRVTGVPPGNHEGHYVMRLPGIPRKVGSNLQRQSRVENSGRLITAKFQLANGVYWRSMVFDEGDPLGQWEISVFVDKKLVRTTQIQVGTEDKPTQLKGTI